MFVDTRTVSIVLVLAHHGFFLSSLFLFTLLPRKLDLDPVHAPHECNLALSSCKQLNAYLVEIFIVSFKASLCQDFPVLLANKVALPASLNFESTAVYQGVELSHAEGHSVAELAQEVLKLEDSAKHVPVTSRLHLSALELTPPSLDAGGCIVCTVSVIDLGQLDVKLRCCATLRIELYR